MGQWGNQPQPYPSNSRTRSSSPIRRRITAAVTRSSAQQGGGFFGELLNSGFGRAIVTGAGFGIGDDLINKIF